ncbi:MlaE family lipid ABC transporter permease subunit [Pseudotabrizicola sediminis]|uniref:MlaE family lipid ABC transporter permease subunit n=1 Tax=Pseudotabrizicola sediminis TaxID=2486418 RepID=A0ABY2KMW8_9RHOB|nr:MlaE family lipid ABC transporter permease subunit [Pseudotabrizicola sediminis]TGD42636.1 MlaE family lipid ABC transporter permease subunit [Pseudotabrizicola sediminis]TGD63668.1 MlaE family lipid ABC transporter permease subunit [Tabrizicola sp. WMC-M-20]
MPATVTTDQTDDGSLLRLGGGFSLADLTGLHATLMQAAALGPVTVDLTEVTRLDTAAAWAIAEAEKTAQAAGHSLRLVGATEGAAALIDTVRAALPDPDQQATPAFSLMVWLDGFGRSVAAGGVFLGQLLGILGVFIARLGRSLLHPSEFRLTSLVHHCQEVGLKAVPIVALMAFLIGVVLAFQGAAQLRQFGAEVFVVDLIAVSILRELGILLTAIIVAGRTASAFTAAIGSMKMREEIDAMRTLGIDPATALIVPRVLALLLMLPILGMIANAAGLLGGGLMSWIELGISPALFVSRLVENTGVSHLMVGMIKAPFFAIVIGIVGCHAGMQVGNNAESLGRQTSSAVVTAIFSVIVIDALFSIFFAQVGI